MIAAFVRLSVRLAARAFVCPSARPFFRPSIRPSACPSPVIREGAERDQSPPAKLANGNCFSTGFRSDIYRLAGHTAGDRHPSAAFRLPSRPPAHPPAHPPERESCDDDRRFSGDDDVIFTGIKFYFKLCCVLFAA